MNKSKMQAIPKSVIGQKNFIWITDIARLKSIEFDGFIKQAGLNNFVFIPKQRTEKKRDK